MPARVIGPPPVPTRCDQSNDPGLGAPAAGEPSPQGAACTAWTVPSEVWATTSPSPTTT